MKIFSTVIMFCLLLAGVAMAASIDGKYYSERKMERDGQSFTIKQTFDLKSDGNKLEGKVSQSFGEREMSADVKDGKIDGDKFSFTTVMTMGEREVKATYEGKVDGDTIKGTITRQGGQGGSEPRPFEAKKK